MSIQRIVCFRFKANVSKQDQQAHMNAFAKLKMTIAQINHYRKFTALHKLIAIVLQLSNQIK